MSNPNKIKGDTFERSIVEYLRERGFNADRTRAGWADDRGDIHGIARNQIPFTFECKNHRRDNLPGWIAELHSEVANNKGFLGAVIHKRSGTTIASDQYATLPLGMLVQLLKEAGFQ
jgi:Restriction endonuclease